MAIRAAQNKKHIYVEKGMCRTLEEAKGIRKAVRDNKVTLQLGHHQNSDPTYIKAREIFQSGKLGKVCLARTYIDRTNPWPEWQFYTAYDITKVPDGANRNPSTGSASRRTPPLRPTSMSSAFSAGAAGGSTARASPAT